MDLNRRAHDLDNLYIVDSIFYPSSAALNPTNTLLANALRVAITFVNSWLGRGA